MRTRSAFVVGSTTLLLLVLSMSLARPATAIVAFQPTVAPIATPGEPANEWIASIPLADPLVSEDQAVEQVMFYDTALVSWSNPWQQDGRVIGPSRLRLAQFASRTEESKEAGRNEWFAPEIDADAGAVWRITVEGEVSLKTATASDNEPPETYDGMTYVISQRTGNLLTTITGPLVKEP
jgi:hypothetical protein